MTIGTVFYIGFVTGPRVDDEGWPHAEGEITLGEFSERFRADLRFWDMRAYEAQWHQAVLRLIAGAPATALVTSYRGPGDAHHFIWPMWRDGSTVHVQHRVLFTDQRSEAFDPNAPDANVGARVTLSEDGEPLPEWDVPLGQLVNFALEE